MKTINLNLEKQILINTIIGLYLTINQHEHDLNLINPTTNRPDYYAKKMWLESFKEAKNKIEQEAYDQGEHYVGVNHRLLKKQNLLLGKLALSTETKKFEIKPYNTYHIQVGSAKLILDEEHLNILDVDNNPCGSNRDYWDITGIIYDILSAGPNKKPTDHQFGFGDQGQ